MPRILIVIRQLVDLPRSAPPEGRGGDVQMGQVPGRQGFQSDVKFVGNGDFPSPPQRNRRSWRRGSLRRARSGLMSSRSRKPRRLVRWTVQKSRPFVHRTSALGFHKHPHVGDKVLGNVRSDERHRRRQPIIDFPCEREHSHTCERENHVPTNQSESLTDLGGDHITQGLGVYVACVLCR